MKTVDEKVKPSASLQRALCAENGRLSGWQMDLGGCGGNSATCAHVTEQGVNAPVERAFFANQGGTADISVLGLLR